MITIQLDCAIAENFDMYYVDQDGEKKRPYIIHRTSMGCYERTLAWLIEKYAGKFPTWLCPEQVRVLPISEKYEAYAEKVRKALAEAGVTVPGFISMLISQVSVRVKQLFNVSIMRIVCSGRSTEGVPPPIKTDTT